MYFLKVYINNELMTVSEKKFLSWPPFEIDFMELFQVFIYTKPYSITIEVCTGSLITEVLDRIVWTYLERRPTPSQAPPTSRGPSITRKKLFLIRQNRKLNPRIP
jgi:hypothetical protein